MAIANPINAEVKMLKSVEGIYRDGKIELCEIPTENMEGARVIVTFLPKSGAVDLPSRGINQDLVADLRAKLLILAEDWEQSRSINQDLMADLQEKLLTLTEDWERSDMDA